MNRFTSPNKTVLVSAGAKVSLICFVRRFSMNETADTKTHLRQPARETLLQSRRSRDVGCLDQAHACA